MTLLVPYDVFAGIRAVAETCERTPDWVVVRALRLYLAGEGSEVLAVRKGREEIDRGEVHNMDDLLAELDAVIDAAERKLA